MKRKIKVSTLQKAITKEHNKGKSVGFVPTMGALHEGHMSLIKMAREQCDVVVCSIFVNPTQFNEKSDLKKYPRTLKQDMAMLIEEGTDYLFHPSVDEIYPDGEDISVEIDLNGLDRQMEGAFRPGHFEGVVQVVHRLLDIVKPDKLFMGQKDFQQFTIIQNMIDQLKMPVDLVVCPIMREEDGLAMSSRNRRLDPDIRKKAGILNKSLKWIKKNMDELTPAQASKEAINKMTIPGFKPEYVTIINGKTLKPIRSFESHDYVVVCTAVWAGEVRLIDNLILKK
ncbi:MAG: pantoate--beta-alanine ligase [Saprospiraceae bacterium]|nr:pantoate--beta-alanine ligase [Saprospiraceae bacterium]